MVSIARGPRGPWLVRGGDKTAEGRRWHPVARVHPATWAQLASVDTNEQEKKGRAAQHHGLAEADKGRRSRFILAPSLINPSTMGTPPPHAATTLPFAIAMLYSRGGGQAARIMNGCRLAGGGF